MIKSFYEQKIIQIPSYIAVTIISLCRLFFEPLFMFFYMFADFGSELNPGSFNLQNSNRYDFHSNENDENVPYFLPKWPVVDVNVNVDDKNK
jgi:hypothetical protein